MPVAEVLNYCERAADGFWAEPLNAVTSLAFVVTAATIARYCRLTGSCHWVMRVLILLAVSIAAGSFLWHTLATSWTKWADVLPIGLFLNVFLLAYMVRVVRLSWWGVLLGFVIYQLLNLSVLLFLPAGFLNGSVLYVPTGLALVVMAIFCHQNDARACRSLLLMVGIFCVSLLLRTLDNAVCAGFPIGTHFVWHLLNAWILYRAMRLLAD